MSESKALLKTKQLAKQMFYAIIRVYKRITFVNLSPIASVIHKKNRLENYEYR